MKIRMQEATAASGLDFSDWGTCIHGSPLDDRGKAAVEFVHNHCARSISAEYVSDTFQLRLDSEIVDAEDAATALRGKVSGSVVLEATTLGFVEVFLCVRALRTLGVSNVSLIYVEPADYAGLRRSQLLHRREFDLSDEVPGFLPIPGATLVTTSHTMQRIVFFLGYEERRLEAAFEGQHAAPPESMVVFGVPAFTPGWEMNSFANNIRVIKGSNIGGGVLFCGAENPAAAYELLEEAYDSLASEERLVVGPIGTKPNGIGAALFAGIRDDVGILYDHPKRSSKRSKALSRWHLYTAELQ